MVNIFEKIKEIKNTRYQGGFWLFYYSLYSRKIGRWISSKIDKLIPNFEMKGRHWLVFGLVLGYLIG